MAKAASILLLLVGAVGLATAAPVITPEIDPGAAGSALALLCGTILAFRGTRKK
jgi:hypothetical protein